jgi:hypothetical protein
MIQPEKYLFPGSLIKYLPFQESVAKKTAID